MNAIYKVIWNDAIRQYQVVNELCRSRRKACSVKAVHTDGAGRSLKRSVLATAAATLIGSAAILGVPGSVWADDFNLGDYAPDIEINIGTGAVNNGEPPKVDFSLLPGSNETIYISVHWLRKQHFQSRGKDAAAVSARDDGFRGYGVRYQSQYFGSRRAAA